MKRINKIITFSLLASMSVACNEIVILDDAEGKAPETKQAFASLCAGNITDNSMEITLTLGEMAATDEAELYIRSSLPFEKSGTIWLSFAGEDFVKEYSEAKGIEYQLLPAAFYSMAGGNSLEITAGSTETERKHLTVTTKNLFGNVIAPGRYLLPVNVDGTLLCELNEDTVLIDLTVREPYTDPDGYELYTGEDLVTVFYINTSMFDPRLANDMIIDEYHPDTFERTYFGIGNIVNLRTASVGYDENTEKVSVTPGNDLRYLLEHYTERILPVQESGRKVCICIEGGGKGIGFCNFTDEQIADFTASVKRLVDTYRLDGINLWDRNTGYDRAEANGFPPMNTTSYPKLIKALREALGSGKLLTLVDYRETTDYFDDMAVMGGIEVGKYLDYAWHGYNDPTELLQVVDPWNEDKEYHSKKYLGTKIVGLDHSCYGCIHWAPRKNEDGLSLEPKQWCDNNRQNIIFVFYDIQSNLQQGGADNVAQYPGSLISMTLGFKYGQEINRLMNNDGYGTSKQYGKWVKDW